MPQPKLLVTSGFLWHVGGVLSVYSHCLLSVYASLCVLISPFDKDTNHIEFSLILMTSS